MFLFPYNKNNCAFVYRLVKKGLISIDEIINKLTPSIKSYYNKINERYDHSKNGCFISNLKTADFILKRRQIKYFS